MAALSRVPLLLAATTSVSSVFADGDGLFGGQKIDPSIVGTTQPADVAVQAIVGNVLGFLAILAVLYGIWGGFNILTAAGNDEKVKKGKTVIVQTLLGLVVIYLANSLVSFVLVSILGGK